MSLSHSIRTFSRVLLILSVSYLFSAAFLRTVRLCLRVCVLSLQPVRGVQRGSRRIRGPGTPPLAVAEPGPVAPRRRDGHARGGDPLTDELQAPGPRRYRDHDLIWKLGTDVSNPLKQDMNTAVLLL